MMTGETIPLSSLVLVIVVVLAGCVIGTLLAFTSYRASLPPEYIYCSQCYNPGHLIPNINPNQQTAPPTALGNSATFQRLGMKSSSRGLEVGIMQLEEDRTVSPATEDRQNIPSKNVSKAVSPKDDTSRVGLDTRRSIAIRRSRRSLVFPQQTEVNKGEDQSVLGKVINWIEDKPLPEVPPQSISDPRRQVRRRASERKERCRSTIIRREEVTSHSEDEKVYTIVRKKGVTSEDEEAVSGSRRYLVTNIEDIPLDSSWPAPDTVKKNEPPVESLREQVVTPGPGLPVISPWTGHKRKERDDNSDLNRAVEVSIENENEVQLEVQVKPSKHDIHRGYVQSPRGYQNLPNLQFRAPSSQSSQAQSLMWDDYGSSPQFSRL